MKRDQLIMVQGNKVRWVQMKLFGLTKKQLKRKGLRAVPWVIKVKINPMSAILAILCIEVAPREILCCTKFFLSGAHILGFTGVPNFGHFGVPRVFRWP